jgi:hypothetical protein
MKTLKIYNKIFLLATSLQLGSNEYHTLNILPLSLKFCNSKRIHSKIGNFQLVHYKLCNPKL